MKHEKKEIGSFKLVTTQGTIIDFIVYDDNTMSCERINKDNIKIMVIKPRFELYSIRYSRSYKTKYIDHYVSNFSYIKKYKIDKDLFVHLKSHGMIRYSTEMAFVYGFEDKKGYDISNQKRAFKRVKTEGVKKLQKQLLIS